MHETWRNEVLSICQSMPSANLAVEKYLKPHFDKRCVECVECIVKSGLQFSELGVFGSYARGDYKGTSDIDFYAVVVAPPDKVLSGTLRQDLEDMGADLVYITRESDSALSDNIRKDGVRLL